jgi:hypothetical protein
VRVVADRHPRIVGPPQASGEIAVNARRAAGSPFPSRVWIDKAATRVGPATVAAVAVALPLIPSEAAASGSMIMIDLAILCGFAAWAAARLLSGQRESQLYGSAVDVALGLFFVWFAGSAARMLDTAQGRPAINMTWAWLGGGLLWFLARQSLRSPRALRALAAVLCAVATGLASYSFYQCGYQMPRDRAAFQRDPDAVMREAGIVAPEGSPIREQFRNRIESREPIATFALTNSLAGYLLPSLVLCIAGLSATSRTVRAPVIAWTVAAVAIAACLLLTKSRSGYVATLFAVAVIGWNLLRGGERIGWKIPSMAVGVVGGLAGLAAATGFLDIQVLSEARLSLGYRWEYWTSTIAMIRDFPLSGCGAGNYQSYYTAYKLPQASEVVADPHNFLFELAAIGGVPALVAWLVAFALWLIAVARKPTSKQDGAKLGEAVSEDDRDATKAVAFGAVLGLPLAAVAGMLAGYPPSAVLILTGVPPAVAMLVCLRPWVRDGRLPWFALPVATLVVLVNLLAAGGIGFPAVAAGWWLVGAMAFNGAERFSWSGSAPRWLWGLVSASSLLLIVAFYLTCYQPVFESQSRLAVAGVAGERGDSRTMLEALRAAADADPWSSAASVQLASLYHSQWLATGSPSAREEFERSTLEALRRDRRAHSLRRELGDLLVAAYGQMGDRAALGDAVALYRDAISLYPNYAPHHAQLAWALWAAGERDTSRVAAREALRLDELNPHREQKLAAQRLTVLDAATSAGPKTANAREWVEWIVRETPESN